MIEEQISSRTLSNCPVCNKTGHTVYTSLTDDLFKAPGVWNVSQCGDHKCSTYWLNPTPLPEEIIKLYENYTTHTTPTAPALPKDSLMRFLIGSIRSSVHAQYGYRSNVPKYIQPILRTIARLHPGWYDSQLNQLLYVPFVPNGHLLDIGCGNGNAMEKFQQLGWRVTGIDFDPKAIQAAKAKNLSVYEGDLQQIAFPENSFDTVFLSHVIEHVPDPRVMLKECHRILKPNGNLIALTPNARSRAHQHFKHHWRGLEIPRHLQIFTPESLETLARQTGFNFADAKTCIQGIFYLWDSSEAYQRTGTFTLSAPSRIKPFMDQIRLFNAGLRLSLMPGKEETILLFCKK